MNSVSKGNKFEEECLRILTETLETGELGLIKDYVKVFQKKGYYSTARGGNIIFDLTIEVWPPKATRYVVLYIVECKNYAHKVPVDDVEEFHAKIKQVADVNVKGILITNNTLQKSAYNVAKSAGMMVIQGESYLDYEIVLYKKERNISTIPQTTVSVETTLPRDVVPIIKLIDNSILQFSKEAIPTSKSIKFNIDRLSKTDIQGIAESYIKKIDATILDTAGKLSKEKLIGYLENDLDVRVIIKAGVGKILGSCDIANRIIYICSNPLSPERDLFVLAHEFGHFVLHKKVNIDQSEYDNFNDSEYSFSKDNHILSNAKNWVEWQANYFAASILLPRVQFVARLYSFQLFHGYRKGEIYVDDQLVNIQKLHLLVKKLSEFFGVTKTAVIYRLNDLGMINRQSRTKTIGQLIDEHYPHLLI